MEGKDEKGWDAVHRLKILIVEDSGLDAELIRRELQRAGFNFVSRCVEREEGFLSELKEFGPDVILSDYSLPGFTGLQALHLTRQYAPATPFLLVTGSVGEPAAVECIKAGADDYVLKDRLGRLAPAVIDALRQRRIALERENAEAALRESEQMFRMITESMSDLVAVLDLKGRRLYNSPSYRNLLGNPDELKGSDSFAEIHPDDRAYIQHVFQETVRTGRGERAEYRFVLKDGGIRYIESVGAVIRDKDGNPDRVVVVSRDVTERKKQEEELRVQKAYFEHLFETAPEGIIVRDKQGRVKQANDEFLKMFGYTREEVLGRSIIELIIPPGHPDLGGAATLPHDRFNIETTRRRKDGSSIDVSIVGTPIEVDGGQIAVYGMYRDISDKKRTEREREDLIKQLQAALSEVKLLSGLLPICAWCKQIRDDQGYYHQIEEYITSHSQVEFTHGICPSCAEKYFSTRVKTVA